MNEHTGVVVQPKDQSVRVIWPVVFRFVAVVWLSYGLYVNAVAGRPADEIDWLPVLCCGVVVLIMPSLVMALGMLCRQVWAYWFAVVSDCTVAALGASFALGSTTAVGFGPQQPVDWAHTGGSIIIGAIALIEGAYLLWELHRASSEYAVYVISAALISYFGWLGGNLLGAD